MSDLTVIINLLLSFILGGSVGWLREKEGKSAGLRTHILVCVGSALFMIISGEMISLSGAADPGRIASGVVTGIGFIGAGCILQAGGGVKGITTAASIWITSAIGIAAGLGAYVAALASAIITIITLELLGKAERKIIKSKDSLE
jgi:putative Mg2+ transporter-C (MgtC) family protein